MAAVAAMLTSATRAAIETRSGAAAAVEARTRITAAILRRTNVGGPATAAIHAAVFTAAVVGTSIGTPVTTRAAVTAAAAEGTLETGTRIAATHTGGIAREVFARRACGTRCACFARK